MRIISRKIFALTLMLSIIITALGNSFSNAEDQAVKKVRIGLFYENSAVSTFKVSAQSGLQIGNYNGTQFNVIRDDPSAGTIMLRKDAYYVISSGVYKEYKPTDASIPAGDKIGPYHVQLGASYASYAAASQKAAECAQKGVYAYPVLTDTWYVWAGHYISGNAASEDITKNLKVKLGEGEYTVVQPASNRIVCVADTGKTMLLFGSSTDQLQLHPRTENVPYMLKVNDRNYRGDIEVRLSTAGNLSVINILPLEEYLCGVVPYEIGSSSPLEALKAQAVAARTFAIKHLGTLSRYGFDMDNTVTYQVYKGANDETATTNQAVDDTKGEVVMYGSGLAQTLYFSSDGGRTEDSFNVWGTTDTVIPYLRSVEDKYESGTSSHYNWEKTLTSAEIKDIMVGRGYSLGDILSLSITRVSAAGRAIELIVQGSQNQTTLKKEACRNTFGLNSQLFKIYTDADVSAKGLNSDAAGIQLGGRTVMTAGGVKKIKGTNTKVTIMGANGVKKTIPAVPTAYTFKGKGWGHAVGMSQEGAIGMAAAGFGYKDILTHYYQGTQVQKVTY